MCEARRPERDAPPHHSFPQVATVATSAPQSALLADIAGALPSDPMQ
jgi:hypothetical protein